MQNNVTPTEDWKRELGEIIFTRGKTIFWTTALVLAAAILIVLVWPPTYAASGSILMRGKMPQVSPGLLEDAEIRNLEVSEEDIVSEVEILNSSELIKQTIVQLAGQEGSDLVEPDSEQVLEQVREIKSKLKIDVVPSSNVIKVELYDRDPQHAEEVLDALLKQYVSYRTRVYNPTDQAEFYEGRALIYRTRLEEIEDEIMSETDEAGTALIDKEMADNVELMKALEEQLYQLRGDLAAKEKEIRTLRQAVSEGDVDMFSFIESPAISEMATHLMTLIIERGRVMRDFSPESNKVKALDLQVAELRAVLDAEAGKVLMTREDELAGMAAKVSGMEKSLAELSSRNLELQKHQVKLDRIRREAELVNHSYETYAQRSEEARISSAIAEASLSADVSIISGARLSAVQIFPNILLTPLLGLVAGFILGSSLAFVSEYLDHTMKRPSDVERQVGLPVICSIRKV
jgi:uncharacterized protein involved in exopolysaccharide biosynthesis